jgi:hypothetical protein
MCLVRDDKTPKTPFDTTTIYCHPYSSSLAMWEKDEIEKLAKHLTKSLKTSDGRNSLWKYFGVSTVGTAPGKGAAEDHIALLALQIEALRGELRAKELPVSTGGMPSDQPSLSGYLHGLLGAYILRAGWSPFSRKVTVTVQADTPDPDITRARKYIEERGWECLFIKDSGLPEHGADG